LLGDCVTDKVEIKVILPEDLIEALGIKKIFINLSDFKKEWDCETIAD